MSEINERRHMDDPRTLAWLPLSLLPWVSRRWAGGSGSDESASRETRTRGTCVDWKISCWRGVFESTQIEAANWNGKSDGQEPFCGPV